MASSRYRPRPRELRRLVALFLGFLLLAGSLSACGQTERGSAIRDVALERGAAAYDAGVENCADFLGRIASVGSIRRNFLNSKERAEAYRLLFWETPVGADVLLTDPEPQP